MGDIAFKCIYRYFLVSMHDTKKMEHVFKHTLFSHRSDYLWLLAMLMTSPLVVTLGISLTVSSSAWIPIL